MRWAVSLAVALGIAVLLWSSLRNERDGRTPGLPRSERGESSATPVLDLPLTTGERSSIGSELDHATSDQDHVNDRGWLEAGIRITGRVVRGGPGSDSGPHTQAAGVDLRIALSRPDEPDGSYDYDYQKASCTTDPQGRFSASLADPVERPLSVVFLGPDGDEYEQLWEQRSIPAGESSLHVELLLRTRGPLEGRTVEPDGSPVAGVVLSLRSDLGADRGVQSDAEGWFRVESYEPSSFADYEIEVDHPTHVLLRVHPTIRGPQGWLKEVVLVPSGELAVEVRDQVGDPLPGVYVSCGGEGSATTGVDGRALLTRVPVGQRLSLDFHISGPLFHATHSYRTVPLKSSSRKQDELLFGLRDGDPIILEPGSPLQLRARLARARVHGRVVYASGEPVAHPFVRLQDADTFVGDARSWDDTQGEADGSFSTVLTREELRAIRVIAIDGDPVRRDQERKVATAMISAEQIESEAPLTLIVQPQPRISGRVMDAGGTPLQEGSVLAVPAGSTFPLEPILELIETRAYVRSGGFDVQVPGAGAYDLWVEVSRSGHGDRQRFENIPAGARDVRLVIDRAPVLVQVRADPVVPFDALELVVARYWPRSGERGSATSSEEIHVRQPDWPAGVGVPQDGYSLPDVDDEGLSLLSILEQRKGTELELTLSEGWYVFGLAPGAGYAGMATGRTWLGPGRHTVVFHLLPSAKLTGALRPTRPDLAVQLASEGVPVPLRVRWTGVENTLVRVDMLGRFAFDAPVGEYTLRVGRDEDLLRGVFELEVPVSIHAGENPPLALVLR